MQVVLVDVSDLVEFLQRRESVSGVQRVIAETAPLLLEAPTEGLTWTPVVLDRGRGCFVPLTEEEAGTLLLRGARIGPTGASRDELAVAANACLQRVRTAPACAIDTHTTMLFLGAVWISDVLMKAAWAAHGSGARCVYLLYDLTPVLETGHTAAVNRLFHRYLELILRTADAIPAISASSRNDLATYAQANNLPLPSGSVTRLPCGITPSAFPQAGDPASRPWPRPYALFVGTVESRKQHILALHAWRQLIQERGTDAVPDLVCIGRLGWHSDEFLDGYVRSDGLGGKVALLSASVTDQELAAFYAHAQFTIYPSRYEGWGLPVSESLAFGKVPVITASSSLPEAGGDLAVYLSEPTAQALATAVATQALDEDRRARWEDRIEAAQGHDERLTITWTQVAGTIREAVVRAGADSLGQSGGTPMAGIYPTVELGREYVLAGLSPTPDSGYSDQVMRHLQDEGLTPLLRQPREATDYRVADPAVVGHLGSPQTWGIEVRPGAHALIRFTRPVDGPLVVVLATRSMPGVVRIEATGPGGPVFDQVYLGAALTLPVGDGNEGEPAQVRLTVTDASDSIEGFLGLRSLVILRADDLQTRLVAEQSAARALRQELDFITGTRSWKITAPLRRLKGRSAGS